MTPIIGDLIKEGFNLIDDLFTSDEEKAAEKLKLKKLAQKGDLVQLQARVTLLQGQMKINLKEAEHKSIFVAGWRPFVGWVCGFSLAYISTLEPLMRFIAKLSGYAGEFPVIDTALTLQVLLGMLGLGVIRSVDKYNKVETNSIDKENK